MRIIAAAIFLFFSAAFPALAQDATDARPGPALVYLDTQGVVRWRENDQEVALFGANYCVFSGQDYRMAGHVSQNRKAMIEEDLGHFARMGWTGMRLCSWGDWENADIEGNLIDNDHLDLMDYLIAEATERGIYMLLTPIHTYNPGWPDAMETNIEAQGFSRQYARNILGTDPRAIAAQVNYIGQLLNHVNRYTGRAYKDEPNIIFVEMINEPVHHPEDEAGSIAYINALNDAVRDTGARQITFHNLTQDMRISTAIARSEVDGFSFGWYPSGLVAGRTLPGNFLQAVDAYPDLLRPELANRPRISYEFDPADLISGTMFPAIARTYRSGGGQFASVFAYDMLQTAPYNLGWQTHFINLAHTPRKAMSAVIAAEAMRRLPRMETYGRYPESLRFGDFHISYEDDSSVLAARDAYMNAGDTKIAAPAPRTLARIAGQGSSPLIEYEGTGAYFLDKVRDGVWRLEVYPDALLTAEPFAQPRPGRVVSRLYWRAWPMRVALPDLGARFTATPINVSGDAQVRRARGGVVPIEPGVWLLSRNASSREALPDTINGVGFAEFHINAPQTYPDHIATRAPQEFVAGAPIQIRVQVASASPPDSVTVRIRASGSNWFQHAFEMQRVRGYDYAATIADLPPRLYEYVVTSMRDGEALTFPGPLQGQPGIWPFSAAEVWRFRVTAGGAPIQIFDASADHRLLSFVRPEEQYRTPFFAIVPGEDNAGASLGIGVPVLGGDTPALYAGALYVGDDVAARGEGASRLETLAVRLRATRDAPQELDLLLIEKDGSSWRGVVRVNGSWSTQRLALRELEFSRSIHIPSPFPGLWNYWREGPAARAGTRIEPISIERLEIRVRRDGGAPGGGVEIDSVWLEY